MEGFYDCHFCGAPVVVYQCTRCRTEQLCDGPPVDWANTTCYCTDRDPYRALVEPQPQFRIVVLRPVWMGIRADGRAALIGECEACGKRYWSYVIAEATQKG